MTTITAGVRFRDQAITFANGAKGRVIEVPSRRRATTTRRSPHLPRCRGSRSTASSSFPPVHRAPPGCLSSSSCRAAWASAPVHLAHAETLTSAGLAAFVLDPFGARGVTSTVSNQTQYSFAASAYDVLAAWQVLAQLPEIDAARIGAQGHSRGGAAVLTAATRRFADAVVGRGRGLAAVLAAYPWSGHQFLDPGVGATRIRVLMGDRDEWCSLQQVQGHLQAMRLAGGAVSLRVFSGAAHSFDRGTAVVRIDDAAVAPGAPTTYLADDGSCIHPITGQADPTLTDRDVAVYGLKAGYGVRGASLGGTAGRGRRVPRRHARFWTTALAWELSRPTVPGRRERPRCEAARAGRARRTGCTSSARPRAPTKQMGPYRRPLTPSRRPRCSSGSCRRNCRRRRRTAPRARCPPAAACASDTGAASAPARPRASATSGSAARS